MLRWFYTLKNTLVLYMLSQDLHNMDIYFFIEFDQPGFIGYFEGHFTQKSD